MDSSLISQVEKAMRYAHEKDRVKFSEFKVQIKGDNELHDVTYRQGAWSCTCRYFQSHGVCSHAMAMERTLSGMLPKTLPQVLRPALTPGASPQPA